MNRKILWATAAVAMILGLGAASAQAATYDLTLSGDVGGFSESEFDFSGLHFHNFSVGLSGLNADNAITVAQGDQIHATVNFNGEYTIPVSQVRTDILHYLFGSSFPDENTGVNGTFNFYDGATLVNTFGYSSTTSGQMSSFAAVFPPSNGAFTFDSFTNNFTISSLGTPATLDASSFTYSLVSDASTPAPIPEPAAWALMLAGFGGIGAVLRLARRNGGALASI